MILGDVWCFFGHVCDDVCEMGMSHALESYGNRNSTTLDPTNSELLTYMSSCPIPADEKINHDPRRALRARRRREIFEFEHWDASLIPDLDGN